MSTHAARRRFYQHSNYRTGAEGKGRNPSTEGNPTATVGFRAHTATAPDCQSLTRFGGHCKSVAVIFRKFHRGQADNAEVIHLVPLHSRNLPCSRC